MSLLSAMSRGTHFQLPWSGFFGEGHALPARLRDLIRSLFDLVPEGYTNP